MLKRFLLAVAALLAAPAAAQQWTVADQGANFAVPSAKPTGAAPADAFEGAVLALPNGVLESDWIVSTGDQLTTVPITTGAFLKGSDREKKIRINCEPAGLPRMKDNILGKGVKKFGHPHQGSGSIDWNEHTTYELLRNGPRSSCVGGPIVATNYMEPAMLKRLSNGAVVGVRFQDQANYYVLGIQSEANAATWLRAGTQFIMGGNPKDFNDTARRAEYTSASLLYPGGPRGFAGQLGWYCLVPTDGGGNTSTITVSNVAARLTGDTDVEAPEKSRYLKGPAGEDPWGGACVANAFGPAQIVSDLKAPGCWDRHNLTAPDGRGHMRYAGRNSANTLVNVCPKTTAGVDYAEVPDLEVKNIWLTTGFADYGQWYLDSDRMRVSTTECPDAAAPCDGVSGGNVPATVNGVSYSRVSISLCRKVSVDFCNGETVHADWTYGWHRPTFDQMQRECLGIPVRGVATTDGPAECNAGQIDRYNALRGGTISQALSAWTGGCTNVGNCNDATPSKPREQYAIVPGYQPGAVHIGH